MNVRHVVLTCAGAYALAGCSDASAGPGLPSCGASGTPLSLAVAQYSSVNPATDSGCVTFVANNSADTAEYLVLPWSVGGLQASAAFQLQSAAPAATPLFASRLSRFAAARRGETPVAFDHFLRELGRSRRYPVLGLSPTAALSTPQRTQTASPPVVGDKRSFKVCSNMKCSPPLTNVGAVAKSVGQHIAIYVDTLAPAPGLPQGDLDSLRDVFDTRLYTLDTVTFGHVSDIDGNGVVIVLMTNQVNKLIPKSQCANGFIAGFFFPGDLDPSVASQFNNGEVFYSIVADSLGTLSCAHTNDDVNFFTPVTFTHEFQHMINFVEHVLVRNGNGEDGWLDEGLSKYGEEIAGRSFGDNAHFSQFAIGDVFDANDYLQNPGAVPLMIPADTGTLAMVGASWLFTRYIVDQFGDSLPGKLVQSALTGVNNIATKTGQPFDQTVMRWAFANWVDNLSPTFTSIPELQYSSWNFRHTFDTLFVQDPQDFPRPYPLVPTVAGANDVNVTGTLWSGSGEYVRVMQPPHSAEFTLRLSAPGGGQVSASVQPRLNVLRIR